jgi:CheY-like chemotaxis protein
MARIVVINPSLGGVSLELGESWATIGRADGNTFQVVEASISGRHCEVRLQGDELLVRDLLSTNGTFVGGQKISEGVVKVGQTLRLGDVELRFENSAPTSSPGTSFVSKMLLKNAASPTTPEISPVTAKPVEETPTPPESVEAADKKFHVLFVDDSLAFLETFGGLCSEFAKQTWQIHSATSADRALQILQADPVDLVVLDIGMPMLDGLQLLGIITRRYPGLKIAVMTGKATEARRADALANGAELFLEKPVTADGMKSVFNMLNDLVSWAHLEGFTGALRQVGMQEIIQMECNGRHSSILEIRNAELRGQIFIEAGAITHAAVGTLTGEQAFYRLLSLRGGEFSVKPFKAPPQRTIVARWEFLLMDAARASDEETVLIKNPAATEPPPAEKSEHTVMGEDLVVITDSGDKK